MIRGLYSAASGMITAMRRMEVVTNNIANAQTTAYKQERTATTVFSRQLQAELDAGRNGQQIGPLVLNNVAEEPELDLGQGSLRETGRSLDLALEGSGFFVIQTAQGTRYTRDGSFLLDSEGTLVATDGSQVIGQNGPIRVPDGRVSIDKNGSVLVDDQAQDRLLIVDFDVDVPLKKVGLNRFEPRDAGAAPQPVTLTAVHQGFIEASNVDITGAQTSMIELQRGYEAAQRMIQFQDEMMGRAVNDIARPVS